MPSVIYEQVVSATPDGSKEAAFGAVYTTLNRMADRHLLSVGSTIDAKGRDRRTFGMTASGQRALNDAMYTLKKLDVGRLIGALA